MREEWDPITVKFTAGCSLGIAAMFFLSLGVSFYTNTRGRIPGWIYPVVFVVVFALCWLIPTGIAAAMARQQNKWERDPRHGGMIGKVERMFKSSDDEQS